jgi:hypothetical protein
MDNNALQVLPGVCKFYYAMLPNIYIAHYLYLITNPESRISVFTFECQLTLGRSVHSPAVFR